MNYHYVWLKVGTQLVLQRVDDGTKFLLESHDIGTVALSNNLPPIIFHKKADRFVRKLETEFVGFDSEIEQWFDNMEDDEENDDPPESTLV